MAAAGGAWGTGRLGGWGDHRGQHNTVSARSYQAMYSQWGLDHNIRLPWRHLEEDSSPGVPGDHGDPRVSGREAVGVCGCGPDWLRPHRIRQPRHIRGGRFLKIVSAPGGNITIVFND